MKFQIRAVTASLVVTATATVGVNAAADGPSADACATASDDAQPLRKMGKLREAKERLLVCVDGRCPSLVRNDCTVQLSEVEQAMPTIVFTARDASGARVAAVILTMDGVKVADHLDGTLLPVDPGEHRFVFEAAGVPPLSKELVIREGEKDRRENIVFGTTPARSNRSTTGSAEDRSTWPTYTAFGVGAAGIVLGSVFGVLALQTKSALDSECPSKAGCPKSDVDALNTRGWVSNAGFAVGIIGAGIGTVLLLTSGGADHPSVGVTVGPTSVALLGILP